MTALRAVKTAKPAPTVRQVTLADAERLYSDPHNAARRLRAIKYLRERSRTGWLLDQPAKRKDAL